MLVGSASMLLLPPAHAAAPMSATSVSTSTPVLQQAWYWQNAYEQANPPVAEAPPATEPSGVPDGDLAVAYAGNTDKSPSKMTALSFDMSAVPSGASVESFTFSLTVDSDPTATSFNTAEATLVACQPTRLWPALLGGDYTNEPSVDCSKKVVPTVSGDTYTFKIPTIAQSWIDDQNLGVALVPDPATTVAPFQVVFKSAKTAHGSLVYLPASALSTVGSTEVAPTAPSPASVPVPAAPAPAALPPASAGATASTVPPPVVASAATAPPTRPVAAVKAASAAPTGAFWLAGIVVGALLLLASLVLGDPVPAPVAAPRTRLDQVLRSRESGELLSVRSL